MDLALNNLQRLMCHKTYQTKPTKPRFIIIESSSFLITNLSLFIIEKVISVNFTPITVKKLKNWTLLVEVEKKKHANLLLKMTMLYNIPVKTYSHKSLNINKGIVRSNELSLCTIEEIKKELKKTRCNHFYRFTFFFYWNPFNIKHLRNDI